jgi:hypothetical protein
MSVAPLVVFKIMIHGRRPEHDSNYVSRALQVATVICLSTYLPTHPPARIPIPCTSYSLVSSALFMHRNNQASAASRPLGVASRASNGNIKAPL